MTPLQASDAVLVAIFEDRRVAEGARNALLSAGVPADAVELVQLEQSHILVYPTDAAEREVAIEALQGCGPLRIEQKRRNAAQPGEPAAPS